MKQTVLILAFTTRIFSQDWSSLQADPVTILFQTRHRNLAERVEKTIRDGSPALQQFTGLSISSPVKIFITQSDHLFNELTRHHVPDWGAGVTDPERSLIILKSRPLRDENQLRELVIHEYVHVLMGQNFPQSALPRWFEEGIAEYLSKTSVDYSTAALVSRAMITDQLVGLDEVEEVLRFQTGKARLAYAESFLAFSFLVQNLPEKDLRSFITALQGGPDFQSVLFRFVHKDWLDFQIAYHVWLRENYRWNWMVDIEFLIWLAILLVCVGVLFYIKKRNRKILARWELEESLEPYEEPKN